MNKIVNNIDREEPSYNLGSIWRDSGYPDHFILGRTGGEDHSYIAINLNDGRPWDYLKNTKEEAVAGLVFVASEVEIAINNKG